MNKDDIYIKNKIEEYYKNKDAILDEPFYIINIKDIITKYTEWNAKLPNIKPYYAVKCNNNEKIIKILNILGCNFDCASKREIELIKNITNDDSKENIIYAHPCKMISHLKYAKENNVNLMTFDCVEELYKIKKYHENAKLLLRICVDDSKSLCKFNSKFGCKIEDIDIIFDTIINLKLDLTGFSFHVGSGCKDHNSYYTALKMCKDAYIKALNKNIKPTIIDIGGGFPGINDENISFDAIVDNINKGIKEYFTDNNINISFIAEPGRYLVEKSHTLVLSVVSKKKEDNVIKYYLNDGVYGSFNSIYYDHQKPELIPYNLDNTKGIYNSTFFGPTCDSMDVIYKNIPFKELKIGDIIYVKNFGAYTISPSTKFNGYSVIKSKYIYI